MSKELKKDPALAIGDRVRIDEMSDWRGYVGIVKEIVIDHKSAYKSPYCVIKIPHEGILVKVWRFNIEFLSSKNAKVKKIPRTECNNRQRHDDQDSER